MASRIGGRKGTEHDVIGHRIAAIIIDWIILGIISLVIMASTMTPLFFTGSTGVMGAGAFALMMSGIFSIIIINFLYGFILEGWRGQTLGKMALGIVVVKENGSPCDYTASFIRNILRIIDGILFYVVGLIVIVATKRRQRLGDLLAKTVVVKVKK